MLRNSKLNSHEAELKRRLLSEDLRCGSSLDRSPLLPSVPKTALAARAGLGATMPSVSVGHVSKLQSPSILSVSVPRSLWFGLCMRTELACAAARTKKIGPQVRESGSIARVRRLAEGFGECWG